MERIRKERRQNVCALSPSKKFNFTQNSSRAAARMKKRLLRKRIKTGGVYLGFDTSGGRKFPHGNFRTTRFLRSQNTPAGGTVVPLHVQQSFAPAGMLSLSMRRFSFSSFSADSSMPLDSCPIILRGGRLVTATTVLPTSSSGL